MEIKTHLPNEIWLHIASYCEPRDLWLSFRQVNRQLQQCAETHFAEALLPYTILTLPITLPTYDVRSPIQGRVIFHPGRTQYSPSIEDDSGRATFHLIDTEPDHYLSQFMIRWKGIYDSTGGRMKENMRFEFQFQHERKSAPIKLYDARVSNSKDDFTGEPQVLFDWKASMTSFFQWTWI